MKEKLKQAYLLGFMASGEGWNAEYPFNDGKDNPENDKDWVTTRDEKLKTVSRRRQKR